LLEAFRHILEGVDPEENANAQTSCIPTAA